MAEFNPSQTLRGALWLAVLVALVAGGVAAFRLYGEDFGSWWLKSGPFIGLATAAVGQAWGGVDRNPGLVSANPRIYCGAALQLVGLPVFVFGGHLRTKNLADPVWLGDRVLILPLALIYATAMFGWLLLIAPAQYFAFLVFGSPSRFALASRLRVHARLTTEGRLEFEESTASVNRTDRDAGWWDASLRDRPVAITGAFMGAGFTLLNLVLAA